MNFNQALNNKINTLTKSEKKLATYIYNHPDEVIYDTIKSLGEKTSSGDATIIRLCKKLGFSGFSELKINLAQESMTKNDSKEQENTKYYDESASILIDSIERTHQLINEEALNQALHLLKEAKNIYVFGVGHSGETARDYSKIWLRIGLIAQSINDPHFQLQLASQLTNKDTVIGLSLSGHTSDTYEAIKLSKNSGAKIIVITNDPTSPIAQLGDVVLQTAASEFTFIGSAAGQVSQLYIGDVLARGYQIINKSKTEIAKSKTLKSIIKKSI